MRNYISFTVVNSRSSCLAEVRCIRNGQGNSHSESQITFAMKCFNHDALVQFALVLAGAQVATQYSAPDVGVDIRSLQGRQSEPIHVFDILSGMASATSKFSIAGGLLVFARSSHTRAHPGWW